DCPRIAVRNKARSNSKVSNDVRALLVAKLPKADYFALQLDEFIDVSNDAQLFCDLSTKMSNVRSLTRYEIFHPYLSFSSYSFMCPSLIEYRVMANCKGEKMSIINRIN